MGAEKEQAAKEKNSKIILIAGAVLVLALVLIGSYFVISKLRANDKTSTSSTQEQFVGQAETSQQLQSECQNSINTISESTSAENMVAEFKKHVESCREVYFTNEKKSKFRTEGMYPDIAVDIIHYVALSNKALATELLTYIKTLEPWEFYMGPIVCDSRAVVAAYEESFNSTEQKVCIKVSEFKEKIFSELRNKNFSILSRTLPTDKVAWLGSPEADAGCPEKISTIIQMAQKATTGNILIEEADPQNEEANDLSVVFRSKEQEDKLMLEFSNSNECLQLKSALVPGLQSNE